MPSRPRTRRKSARPLVLGHLQIERRLLGIEPGRHVLAKTAGEAVAAGDDERMAALLANLYRKGFEECGIRELAVNCHAVALLEACRLRCTTF